MSKNKPYSAVNVKDVNLEKLLAELAGVGELFVGIDVGKASLLVAVCHGRRLFTRAWRVSYPGQLQLLVELLSKLAEGRKLTVAMEPTGTYADPLRHALGKAGLTVLRIESKASHDYAEIFDGTPSQHDTKDAMMLAEMNANGQGSPWPLVPRSERDAKMRVLVQQADDQQAVMGVWNGRLEGLLARHWPEATGVLDLDSSTLLRALADRAEGPGPDPKRPHDGGGSGRRSGTGAGAEVRPVGPGGAPGTGVNAAAVGEAGRGGCGAGADGQGGGPCNGVRAVGAPGGSTEVFQRGSVPEGGGAEPGGAVQRPVRGAVEDQQAGAGAGAEVAVHGGGASAAAAGGCGVVRGQAAAGRRRPGRRSCSAASQGGGPDRAGGVDAKAAGRGVAHREKGGGV